MNKFCTGYVKPLKEGAKTTAKDILSDISPLPVRFLSRLTFAQGGLIGSNNGYLAGVLSLGAAVGLQFLKKDKKGVPAR